MKLHHEWPTPKQYNELARAMGLPDKEEVKLGEALSKSLFGVTLTGEDGEMIGMGRIIGDGSYIFMITDLILHPDSAHEDHICAILQALMDFIESNASQGAEIVIMADVPSIGIYQKHGFNYTYPNKISLSRTL
ncbi:N-acetyltransferase [Paenibacillus sp. 1011MAR3C5]|uniref:GNAT family N-acetyltransferase n=1 Tax=Paenibacillus sp. 1011MAR3C5 TaxID=1675787 RepID=UPI000E6B63A8|nr:GNAT family N-acetyltransferase [Paenibacillus sp. 1011MAR3C5]RJE90320.1 N-acetyltransferase [Paenibacillus sp. 1011MAR3C5]